MLVGRKALSGSWTKGALLLLSSALFTPLVLPTQRAHAAIVERVVAIVGEDAILLSDLKERAMPYLLRIYQTIPEGPARSANISQLYRMVLNTMIDEELEKEAAFESGVKITEAQIDSAIEQTADQNGISVNELLIEAKRSGLTIKNYREELRRQLIQRAMMEVRLAGRVNIDESDLQSTYRELALDERLQLEQRTLALILPKGRSPEEKKTSRALAAQLSRRAQQGEDLRELIDQYSPSSQSGLRPAAPPSNEPEEIQRATLALEVGQVSEPVSMGNNWIVLQVIERPPSELPAYNEARQQIHERVYMEKLTSARQHWLNGLRRRAHVEVRL